ncbi:MAG: efflux transporter outer membrane subunit [Sphingomonas fennica]
MKRRLGLIGSALAALSLGACAAGPDYVRPETRVTAAGDFVDRGGTTVATPAAAADPRWWRLYDDPTLDRLVADALAYNTDVRAAVATLRQARAVLSEARTARLPTTDASASYNRRRIGIAAVAGSLPTAAPGTGAGTPSHFDFDFFQAGFDAAYEVDLFGRVSRSVEAARGDTEAAAADLDAARIAVAAEVARSYALACANAAQADVARETAALQDRTLDLTRRLLAGGRGTQREVDQAAVLAENARATVPSFEAERRAALYALAALTGRPPAELDPTAAQCRQVPQIRVAIPVGDGATLLARRPDVRGAERRLAAQTARIGVATAALYPSISLAGSTTLGNQRFGDLAKSSSFGLSLGPLISWRFPNISAARAQIRQAEAGTEAALARFDGTVLTALTETEQALARYAGAIERIAALGRAEGAASNAAAISRLRFDTGRDSFLQLLDAERDRASARTALAQAQQAVVESQVALFQALGGGWENAPPPAGTKPVRQP